MHYQKVLHSETAPWVLFIHGLGGSMKTWKYQLDKFSDKYNILLVDLEGHGKSSNEKTTERYKPAIDAEKIYNILIKENISKIHLISLSLGTLVAFEFVRLFPEVISSAVFAGTIINLDLKRKILLGFVQTIKRIVPVAILYKIFANIILPRKNHKKSREIFIRESKKLNKPVFLDWVRSMSQCHKYEKDYMAAINNIHKKGVKTLFISGEEDYMFLKGAKNLNKKISEFAIKIIQKCGHVCSIEKANIFNETILKFIEKKELNETH